MEIETLLQLKIGKSLIKRGQEVCVKREADKGYLYKKMTRVFSTSNDRGRDK